jgi:murein DD-endopeptidase MepM/ murein hydrolase activator NlpD
MTPAVSPIDPPLYITQRFGERPWYYKKYGLAGHNGLDLRCKTGTPFYAMLPGIWTSLTERSWRYVRPWNPQGWYGYGAAWRLYFNESNGRGKELTFAHLQNRQMKKNDGKNLPLYDQNTHSRILLAQTDNTGDSTGPHLHIGLRQLVNGAVEHYGNGFKGSIDPLPWLKNELGLKFSNA